jgi:hypothetical protein
VRPKRRLGVVLGNQIYIAKQGLHPGLRNRLLRVAALLQENDYLVLRFLTEDVGKELDLVLDTVLRALSPRRSAVPTISPLTFVRRSRT